MAVRPDPRPSRDVPDVRLPSAADDRPAWGKVAILAVVGFAVGIAWPRLAGVRLGPSAPSESIPAAAAPAGSADGNEPRAGAAPASLTGAADDVRVDGGFSGAAAGAAGPLVSVQRGAILSCRTAAGELEKGSMACGDLAGLDSLVTPHLRKLATCPAAVGQAGKLSVVLGVDFPGNRVTVGIGHSSTVPDHDALAPCLHAQLDTLSLAAIAHDKPRYTVQYTTTLGASGAAPLTASAQAPPPSSPSSAPAAVAAVGAGADDSATPAQVVWEVAIVRDTPRTGSVVARLPRGTKLRVASGQDGWFKVKYGAGFTSEGYLYRAAIGR